MTLHNPFEPQIKRNSSIPATQNKEKQYHYFQMKCITICLCIIPMTISKSLDDTLQHGRFSKQPHAHLHIFNFYILSLHGKFSHSTWGILLHSKKNQH
uniref:Uncharacterized protein n=1 Tax=Arundo donax TaxID=35708 RepID=A0A0A9HSD7_ARUDO